MAKYRVIKTNEKNPDISKRSANDPEFGFMIQKKVLWWWMYVTDTYYSTYDSWTFPVYFHTYEQAMNYITEVILSSPKVKSVDIVKEIIVK